MRILSLALLLTGCAHLTSVSVTPIPAQPGLPIEVMVESDLMILGITGNNDYADEVVRALRDKCKDGEIKGILTKHEVVSYFVASRQRITASGRCFQ